MVCHDRNAVGHDHDKFGQLVLVCYIHGMKVPSPTASDVRSTELLDQLDESLLGIRRVFFRAGYRQRLLDGLSRDLTLATLRLLRAIERSDGPPSVGDVADALTIDPSTASRLVDGAVDAGLVERHSCTDDRRSRRLRLTTGGEAVVEEVTARRRQLLGQVTEGWDPDELAQLTEMLSTLRTAFDELEHQ